ncbi:MAG: VWA domain-containing protein [Pseudomonadota bacterium]
MTKGNRDLTRKTGTATTTRGASSSGDLAAFLQAAERIKPAPGGKGRVILALDATMSRQPTWDLAVNIQGEMFEAVDNATPLHMQLVYFRGYGECRASNWATEGQSLAGMMSRITCHAGRTQIGKVLTHARKAHAKTPISAMVYIGDAMEEDADAIGHRAGELGVLGVPVFVFQEGHDRKAEVVFKEIARLTRGSWFRFDRNAPKVLADLLSSIAVYATGGLKALTARGTKSDRLLIDHMKGDGGKK